MKLLLPALGLAVFASACGPEREESLTTSYGNFSITSERLSDGTVHATAYVDKQIVGQLDVDARGIGSYQPVDHEGLTFEAELGQSDLPTLHENIADTWTLFASRAEVPNPLSGYMPEHIDANLSSTNGAVGVDRSGLCGWEASGDNNWFCVLSWCDGGCVALDCVGSGSELHFISGCGAN